MFSFLKKPNIKFDLHVHSTYSDGLSTVKEIMDLAKQKGLEYISITEHNNVEAYAELKKHNNYGFTGKVITGCEINTVINGYYVEFLAYGFDVKKLKKFNVLNIKYFKKKNKLLLKNVILKAKSLGFKVTKGLKYKDKGGLYYKEFYEDLLKYNENKPLLKKLCVNNYKDLLRKQIMSPEGALYVLVKNGLPSGTQVCDFVHKCGGKVIFAHPFYYGVKNPEHLIKIALSYDIDGIEGAHFSHTTEQINYVKELCVKNNLICTGGSDFHNKPRTVGNKSYKSELGYLSVSKKNLNTNILGID